MKETRNSLMGGGGGGGRGLQHAFMQMGIMTQTTAAKDLTCIHHAHLYSNHL